MAMRERERLSSALIDWFAILLDEEKRREEKRREEKRRQDKTRQDKRK